MVSCVKGKHRKPPEVCWSKSSFAIAHLAHTFQSPTRQIRGITRASEGFGLQVTSWWENWYWKYLSVSSSKSWPNLSLQGLSCLPRIYFTYRRDRVSKCGTRGMKMAEGAHYMKRCTKEETRLMQIYIERHDLLQGKRKPGLGWLLANSMNFICFFHQKLWGKT